MATATDFVRLSSPWQDHVNDAKAALRQLVDIAAVQGGQPQRTAANAFAAHLQRVIRNNPGKDIQQILARPDVQQAVAKVALAADRVQQTVSGAHQAGFVLGSKAVRAQASSLGLKLPPSASYHESTTLHKIQDNVETNGNVLPNSAQAQASVAHGAASQLPPPSQSTNPQRAAAGAQAASSRESVEREGSRFANRSAASSSVAANRGYNEAALDEIKAIAAANPTVIVKKIWVSQLSFNTCPTCAALHGTVLEIDTEFSHDQSFAAKPPAVYSDLECPPRHPACACYITVYIETEEMIAAAAAMRQAGKDFAAQADKAAPKSWRAGTVSPTAQNSNYIESADIRAASDSQFDTAIRGFQACWLHNYG